MQPKYPIYIISKGRWKRRKTSKMFEKLKVPYRICVEPAEYKKYAAVINPKKIIKLPENFSERGQGSIPVRNWVWEHSINKGAKRHWILDDNIEFLQRYNNNLKINCRTPTPFYIVENFVNRYTNVALAGMQYDYFVPAGGGALPIIFNTRIYSCILIKNDIPYRWRGRYNEDTDLSIRVLKDGWCTVLFNAFVVGKTPTLEDKGGNTDTIYNTGDKRKKFAESLRDQHPDIVEIVWRYNRWHHQVDYSGFKYNTLEFKNGKNIKKEINEFGMKLRRVVN